MVLPTQDLMLLIRLVMALPLPVFLLRIAHCESKISNIPSLIAPLAVDS